MILLSACKEQVKSQKTLSTKFGLAHSDLTILTFDDEWYWVFKEVEPADLSFEEINEIEPILDKAINEQNRGQERRSRFGLKLEGYKRQYIAVLNEKGEKEIFINFLCDDRGKDEWKTSLIIVEDGGNCFYSIKVNLTLKTFYDLSITSYG